VRLLTSDGEFHSARRQFARWEEAGTITVERIPVEPFDSFSDRFLAAAQRGRHDLVFVSHVMFASGRVFDRVNELASVARQSGPWVIIDGYHAFMGLPDPLGAPAGERHREPASSRSAPRKSVSTSPDHTPAAKAFYIGGGYKYAMAGEGCAFLHAPEGFAPRPPITGWFAEFEDLSLPPGSVGYAKDARRFMGATFDPSGLYRFVAVRRMLQSEGLTTARVAAHAELLQRKLVSRLHATPLAAADLLNPLDGQPHARFLAFKSPNAQLWNAALKSRNCITDVRGDVLRIGFGLYQDEADVDRLIYLLEDLA
jgi:selenocysteine lyase/cysteine desulfurase